MNHSYLAELDTTQGPGITGIVVDRRRSHRETRQNQLLAALPVDDQCRLLTVLRPMSLAARHS